MSAVDPSQPNVIIYSTTANTTHTNGAVQNGMTALPASVLENLPKPNIPVATAQPITVSAPPDVAMKIPTLTPPKSATAGPSIFTIPTYPAPHILSGNSEGDSKSAAAMTSTSASSAAAPILSSPSPSAASPSTGSPAAGSPLTSFVNPYYEATRKEQGNRYKLFEQYSSRLFHSGVNQTDYNAYCKYAVDLIGNQTPLNIWNVMENMASRYGRSSKPYLFLSAAIIAVELAEGDISIREKGAKGGSTIVPSPSPYIVGCPRDIIYKNFVILHIAKNRTECDIQSCQNAFSNLQTAMNKLFERSGDVNFKDLLPEFAVPYPIGTDEYTTLQSLSEEYYIELQLIASKEDQASVKEKQASPTVFTAASASVIAARKAKETDAKNTAAKQSTTTKITRYANPYKPGNRYNILHNFTDRVIENGGTCQAVYDAWCKFIIEKMDIYLQPEKSKIDFWGLMEAVSKQYGEVSRPTLFFIAPVMYALINSKHETLTTSVPLRTTDPLDQGNVIYLEVDFVSTFPPGSQRDYIYDFFVSYHLAKHRNAYDKVASRKAYKELETAISQLFTDTNAVDPTALLAKFIGKYGYEDLVEVLNDPYIKAVLKETNP